MFNPKQVTKWTPFRDNLIMVLEKWDSLSDQELREKLSDVIDEELNEKVKYISRQPQIILKQIH